MKNSSRFLITFLSITMLAALLLPNGSARAELASQTVKVTSIATSKGGTTGGIARMQKKDQSGTANNSSRYVLFSTPGVAYRGTRLYTLPAYIKSGNISSFIVRVNVKAPAYSKQKWTWKIYDWNAKKWIFLGNNASAVANTWSLLSFNSPANPGRFVNSSKQIKIQFYSNNATGDAKIDSEFVIVTFDYQYSGCGESTNSSFENQVLTLVNQAREDNGGLPPLTRDTRLDAAARLHSADMACNGYFSHDSLLGGTPFYKRIQAQGYSYGWAGENIAAGYATPAAVMTGWMNSSGHRANILNVNYTEIGIGHVYYANSPYGHYWTQDFASPSP